MGILGGHTQLFPAGRKGGRLGAHFDHSIINLLDNWTQNPRLRWLKRV